MANTPEEERQERRGFAERDAREDVRKEVEHILADVHEESISGSPLSNIPILRTLARFASLIGNVYLKAEKQTDRVVKLTWALVSLTAALILLTAALTYYAYLQSQRDNKAERGPTDQGIEDRHSTVPY